MQAGVDGLLRDKTRPSRKPPLDRALIARVVELRASDPPGEATYWTAMAKTTGISVSSVPRIWRSHGLQPHWVRQFKRLENFSGGGSDAPRRGVKDPRFTQFTAGIKDVEIYGADDAISKHGIWK
jgi:hypothetical protein